jgi:hypothetical protein
LGFLADSEKKEGAAVVGDLQRLILVTIFLTLIIT